MVASRLLDGLGWLGVLEDSPRLQGDTRFLKEYFLPAHAMLREDLYRGLLDAFDSAGVGAGGAGALCVRGRLRRLLGDQRGARADFSRALELDDACAAAYAYRGESFIVEDPARAAADLDRALTLAPDVGVYRLWRGYAAFLLDDAAGALTSLGESLRREPRLTASLLLRAIVAQRAGDHTLAEKDLSRAARLDPRCPGIYTLRATSRIERGDEAGAVLDAHEALLRHPENLDAFVRILQRLTGVPISSDTSALAAAAGALTRSKPRRSWTYALRAELSGTPWGVNDMSLVAARCKDLKAAIARDPKRAWLRAFLGRAMSIHDDMRVVRAGLREMDRAVRLAPKSGWIRCWRAEVQKRLGRLDAARRDLDRGLSLDGSYRLAYAWRAELREKSGELAGAASDWSQCAAALPRAGFLGRLARSRWSLGERAQALRALTRLVLSSPRFDLLYSCLASRDAEALDLPLSELRAAAREHPEDADVQAWLGRAHLDAGDLESAVSALDRARRLAPASGLTLAWLGEAAARAGERKLARGLLDLALAGPTTPVSALLWRASVRSKSRDARGAADDLDRARGKDRSLRPAIDEWAKKNLAARRARRPSQD